MGKDKGGSQPLTSSRPYRLEFTVGADRQFRNLPEDVQERLTPHLDALILNPRPPGSKKLKGEDGSPAFNYSRALRETLILRLSADQ